jgi:hypothetical protein
MVFQCVEGEVIFRAPGCELHMHRRRPHPRGRRERRIPSTP